MNLNDDDRSRSSNSTSIWHRVQLVDHKNIYSKILYDVDGEILVNNNSIILNAYKPEMEEALDVKEVRIFRNSTMSNLCYRYFITSEAQLKRFNREREYGSKNPNKSYHVYVDDDCRNCDEYKRRFKVSREVDNI